MKDLWISLFILGIVLFSWPIMSIFEYNLSMYLFLAWFIFIALMFIASRYRNKNNNGG